MESRRSIKDRNTGRGKRLPPTHISRMTVSSTQSSCDHTQKTVFYACNNTNEYEVSYTYSLLFPPLCHRTVCPCVVRRVGQNTIAISYHKINDVIIKKEELKSSRLFDDFLTCTYIYLRTRANRRRCQNGRRCVQPPRNARNTPFAHLNIVGSTLGLLIAYYRTQHDRHYGRRRTRQSPQAATAQRVLAKVGGGGRWSAELEEAFLRFGRGSGIL